MAICSYCNGKGKTYSSTLGRHVTCDGCRGTGSKP